MTAPTRPTPPLHRAHVMLAATPDPDALVAMMAQRVAGKPGVRAASPGALAMEVAFRRAGLCRGGWAPTRAAAERVQV